MKTDREKNLDFLRQGVAWGWWEDVDEDAELPVRVFPRDAFGEYATWAHVWMKMKRFPSMKEAKRAGWGIPLTCETKRIGTYIVRVEDPEQG